MKTMKFTFSAVAIMILSLQFTQGALAAPISMVQAEEAAAKIGFTEVSRRKPKDPFYGSKRADAKSWKTLEVFPRGANATQVAISCNQCKSRKMSDSLINSCMEEVQNLAGALKVDLPGGVIKAFEGKVPEETWELKDQDALEIRFARTSLKCDSGPSGSGIRLDIFYVKK